MQTRELGKQRLEVSAIGLGCMGRTIPWPGSGPDEMIALIRARSSAAPLSSTRRRSMAHSSTRNLWAKR